MNSKKIKQSVFDAAEFRKSIPTRNSFGISELLKMPKFFDIVKCEATENAEFSMFCGGGDDAIALRFYWNGSYEKATLALWTRFASQLHYILDIGAHTGAYSLAALSVNTNARVFSFEPHYMNYARLNLNLRINGFKTDGAFMLAIGQDSKVSPFSISTDIDFLSSGGSIGVRENGATQYVQVVAVDDMFNTKKFSIDLIKIDVEGHEGSCLRGMKKVLEMDQPVIFFECIDEKSGFEVQTILEEHDYHFFEINDESSEIQRTERIYPIYNQNGMIDMRFLNRVAIINKPEHLRLLNKY